MRLPLRAVLTAAFLALACSEGTTVVPDDVAREAEAAAPDAGSPDAWTPFDAVDLDAEDVIDVAPDLAPDDVGEDVFFEERAWVDGGPRPTMPTLPTCESTEPGGAPVITPAASTLVGTLVPMASRVSVANPLHNPSTESGEVYYRGRNFHAYGSGAGQARVRRADLGGTMAPPVTRRSLAWFLHLTDPQMVDDESPNRLGSTDTPYVPAGLRPQEAYGARVLSAINRTIGALQRPERPFQFGVVGSSDAADSGQRNELGFFLDVMNGRPDAENDSGADDDPLPGPDNDPKDPFAAVPFPVPWYFVVGNHDLMVTGFNAPDDRLRASAIGSHAATGTRDYTRWWAPVRTGTVVPDPARRLLSRSEIVAMLQSGPTRPGPVGHGFAATADLSSGMNFTADVIPGLLRLVVFDTIDEAGGSQGLVHRSSLDRFLRPELERAQRDGVLVVVASHHPMGAINRIGGLVGLPVLDAVSPGDIEALATSYPNVVLWLVGHSHEMVARPVRGSDTAHPGYWEVETVSIADWPSQFRVFEIVDNGNGTLSILATLVDWEATTCMERRYRRLAQMDYLAAWTSETQGTANDRNVELVVPVPPGTAPHIAAAMAPERIESETTLRGMR